jgi:RNA polymerase subunit RPABC4/transcription elongation factor Spt4
VRLKSLASHDFRVTGCIDVKPGQVVGAILGGLLILMAAGAYFSGEEAAQTETGRMAIPLAILLGLLLVLGSLGSGKKQETPKPQTQQQPVAAAAPARAPFCPACGKQISSDYSVCPYCGRQLRAKCPSCQKDISGDFVVCPYCGTSLKVGGADEPPPPPPVE